MARTSVPTSLLVVLLGAALHAQAPSGYVVVDDMFLPAEVVHGDSSFAATPWPGGNVPYTFSGNVTATNRARARAAMAEIEAVANVRFLPRTTETNSIHFRDSNVNNSFVGMIGGSQTINITSWSYRYIIVHELLHALGYVHEHQRPDRDAFIVINTGNLQSGTAINFSIINGVVSPTVYDFDSVMHYDALAFSANGLPTISMQPPYSQYANTIGNVSHLSLLDAEGVAVRYGPPAAPTITAVSPGSLGVGGPAATLTVTGERFLDGSPSSSGVPGTRVLWNGISLTTTFVDPTTVTATVPAALLATAGCGVVEVENPPPGGGRSTSVLVPVGASCAAASQFQVNSPLAHVTVDGVVTPSSSGPPAIVTKNFGDPTTLTFGSSTPGVPFEGLLGTRPLVSAGIGGLVTGGLQYVNVDLGDPALSWWNGGVQPLQAPIPGLTTLTFNVAPVVATHTLQIGVASPSHQDGLVLSQGAQLVVEPGWCAQAVSLPLGDDTFSLQPLGFPFAFFGSSYTEVYVGSNGYVTFGQPDTSAFTSPVVLWSGPPRLAPLMTDLDPPAGGEVRFATDGIGGFSVCYDGVPNAGQTNQNTASVTAVQNGVLGTVVMRYGIVDAQQALIGMAAGGSQGWLQPLDLSQGPHVITNTVIFENFASGVDLAYRVLVWDLASGVPLSVR
jgi:hypothetical protein